jgi:hypothetical protein
MAIGPQKQAIHGLDFAHAASCRFDPLTMQIENAMLLRHPNYLL